MKWMYVKIGILVLAAGLLSACGAPSTNTPASPPQATEQALPATPAPTQPTEAVQATEPPATQSSSQEEATVSFANDIFPIIESRCINCHGGQRTEKGLDLKTYDSLMTGSENGPVIAPGDALHSQFVELVANMKMPKRGPKLTPPQIQLFTDWVNQGAQNN